MPFLQLYIHAVWPTKYRRPVLHEETLKRIGQYIKADAQSKNIFVDTIGGWHDHMHCLFCLNTTIPLEKHLQYFKGGSAYWINKHSGLFDFHFAWASEYFAGTVSKDRVPIVRNYIYGQAEHHRVLTFQEEYDKFLAEWGEVKG